MRSLISLAFRNIIAVSPSPFLLLPSLHPSEQFFLGCLCCHCFTNNLLTYNKPYDFSPNYELLTLLPSLITQYLTKSFMPGPLIPLHGVSQMSFSKTLKPLYNDIFKLPLTLTTSSGCQCEHNHFLLLRNLHIVANVNTISINACKSWIS